MIELQVMIEESVHKGFQQGIKTNNQEIVTEEDYKKMRKYNLDMVRNAYLQNEIQLNTERDRRIVLHFLAKRPKYWPIYLYTKFHDMRMLSSKRTEQVQIMNEMKDMIFNEDVPLEEHPDAEEILNTFRNPRLGMNPMSQRVFDKKDTQDRKRKEEKVEKEDVLDHIESFLDLFKLIKWIFQAIGWFLRGIGLVFKLIWKVITSPFD